MHKATLPSLFSSISGLFQGSRPCRGAAPAEDEKHDRVQVATPSRPEKHPKDFALRQRTDSKRAGKQSSRKDCSGGLERLDCSAQLIE
ncbi:MAG TPA: hypothetical protein GX523_18745 [Desulfitobacterium dehalogenans]|uniref:Uncharacterized protein n=1 Tax=Desulfitobacterium dehalogenans TaxID=36854 RepID=A0A7C6Z735_9FIRM|nr:hypothetical protein [Desulfitobacterium dehalogenans]